MGSRQTEDICGHPVAKRARLASKKACSTSRKAHLENVNQRFLSMVDNNETVEEEDLGWLDEYNKESFTKSPRLASQRLKSTVKIIKKQDDTIRYLKKRNAELQESVKSFKMLIITLKQKNMVPEPEKIISNIMDPPDIPKSVKDICQSLLLEPCFIDVKDVAPDDQVLNEVPVLETPLQDEPFSVSEPSVNPILSSEDLTIKEEPIDDRTTQIEEISDSVRDDNEEHNSNFIFESVKMETEEREKENTILKEPDYTSKELSDIEFNFIKSQIEMGTGENLEVHHLHESCESFVLVDEVKEEEENTTEVNLMNKTPSDSENEPGGSSEKQIAANQDNETPKCSEKRKRNLFFTEEIFKTCMQRLNSGESKRQIAASLGINESTLRTRLKAGTIPTSLGGKRIFSPDMEKELSDHIRKLKATSQSITRKQLMKIAFEFAEANNINHLFSKEKQMAGRDWVIGFCQRHHISLDKTPKFRQKTPKCKKKKSKCRPEKERKLVFTKEIFNDCIQRLNSGQTKRQIAISLGIHESTLRTRLKAGNVPTALGRKTIFPPDMEKELADHVRKLKATSQRVTRKQVMKLAFEYAETNNINHLFNKEKQTAGRDWVIGFFQRHNFSTSRNGSIE